MSNEYIYLFTRRDLSHQQRIIQTAHAISNMSLKHGARCEIASTANAVLIGAENEQELLDIARYLTDNGINFELFDEPDLNGEATAISTYPLSGKDRRPLQKFALM